MDGNWSLLAGAMGLQLVQPLRDLYWSESNHATKALIDEYFSFRSSNFGWVAPPAGTKGANAAKPQAWIKNILTWYDKKKFLGTLSVDKREELD